MNNEVLAQEVLLAYYRALACRIEKSPEPELRRICQMEMAKVLDSYPLSVAEFIQKNKFFNFNVLEYLGVIGDYDEV